MMRRAGVALLAFACTTLAAADDRCEAAKSFFADLASRGLVHLDARQHWDPSGRRAWNTVFIQAQGEPIAARP